MEEALIFLRNENCISNLKKLQMWNVKIGIYFQGKQELLKQIIYGETHISKSENVTYVKVHIFVFLEILL